MSLGGLSNKIVCAGEGDPRMRDRQKQCVFYYVNYMFLTEISFRGATLTLQLAERRSVNQLLDCVKLSKRRPTENGF